MAHGADFLCRAVFRVIGQKQQNLRRRLRNCKLPAQRLHGGAVRVHEALGVHVEFGRSQEIFHARFLQN